MNGEPGTIKGNRITVEGESLIKIKDIQAGYGKRMVLFGVDLEIEKGTVTLLMGPNGSGKSTLIKVIAGALRPEKGKIYYKGKDITHFSTEQRINMGIGYLRQNRNIFPALTVKENLELAGYGLENKEISERIDKILSYFPFLKDKLNTRSGLLSGGERQALAIGMVLMKEKEILLLDEPTAGLSPLAAREILKSIERIKKEDRRTILIVEHNIKLVLEWIDNVVIMRNGMILKEFKDPEKFLKEFEEIEKVFLI